MNSVTERLVRQIAPANDIDLLLKTAILPDAEAARNWELWKTRHDLDTVTWDEHRILPSIAPRLPSIAPDCPYLPRVKGLARAQWTRSQLVLRESAEAIDTILAAEIPIMMLKGGALEAAGLRTASPRISADLDIMVPRPLYPQAIARLYTEGWSSEHSTEYAQQSWRFSSGINLKRGRHGDIDVHHQPVWTPLLPAAAIDALWSRSRPATFRGREVRVPTLADMICLVAAHALPVPGSLQGVAWAFDVDLLLAQDEFDPAAVVASARELRTTAACLASLAYLHSVRPAPRTGALIEALERSGDDATRLPKSHTTATDRSPLTLPLRRILRSVARRRQVGSPWILVTLYSNGRATPLSAPFRKLAALVAQPRTVGFETGTTAVPILPELRYRPRGARTLPVGSAQDESRLRHDFVVNGRAARDRYLMIEVAFERPLLPRNFRFDVSVGGVPVARPGLWRIFEAPEAATRLAFAIPMASAAGQSAAVSMQALPEGTLAPGQTAAQIDRARAVPFRIVGLAWC